MSMHVCGQTLVLVDNDATVSEVNQKLVRATLKYIFYHRPENRTFCFNTYEHDISLEEKYSDEVNDLVCAVDTMEFAAKDSNLTDTLTEVITRWKDSDFACRDILVFTDGLEGAALNHEKEELNYLIEKSGYPVYIVMLNQENNADAKKGLLSISIPSGGKLFESEFPGSDAAVDRQLTEMIFSSMDEYALANWGIYEEAEYEEEIREEAPAFETEETVYAEEDTAKEDSAEEGLSQTESAVIFERTYDQGAFGGMAPLVVSAVFIATGLLAAVLGSFVIMKKKRAGARIAGTPEPEEEFFDDYELMGMGTVELDGPDESDTVFLGESETRLLTGSRLVTLTDKSNAGRIFRIMLGAPMSIGRGKCDVVILGDDALSKRHCEIYEKDGEAYVRDLSSSNGTMVNDVKISEQRLTEGDELTIGTHTFKVGIA